MDQPARVAPAAAASASTSSQVRVIVRARPLLPHESHLASDAAKCVQLSNAEGTPSVRVNEQLSDSFGKESQNETLYTFDGVYDPSVSQQSLFDREILPNVSHRIWSGQTASLFAYGMTGTGKSHTMNGRESDPGIIPRTVQHLFEELQDRVACDEQEWATTFVHVSAFELYNEKIYDLLKPATVSAVTKPLDRNAPDSSVNKEAAGDLPVREDATGKVFVAGLHESKITSYEQFQSAYALAMKNRKIASTKFNATSSRAHTMILLKIEFKSKKQPQKKITGRLQLLDLAGNEDNRFSGNTGSKGRMVESCKINNSLFVLGKVINALNAGENRIPYRDSKLTRLLAAGLGGSNYALMICCISPNPSHVVWTQRTLSFAMKSRQVVNVVEKNVQEGPTAAQIAEEERKNDLKMKLEQWKKEHNRPASAAALPSGPVKTAKRILPGGMTTTAAPSTMASQQVNVTVNKTVTDPSLLKKINSLTQDMHAMKTALQKQQQLQLRPATAPKAAAATAASIPAVSHAPTVPLTPMSSATLARSSVEKAKVYEKCGQFLMALNEYREAARIRPGNEKLQLKIAQVEAKVARMESVAAPTSASAGMKRPLDAKNAAAVSGINKQRKLSPVSKKTILEEEEGEEEYDEEAEEEEEEEDEEDAYEDSDASDYDPMEDEESAEELWMKRNKGTRASRAAARANSKETSPITSPTSTSLLQRVTNSCAASMITTTTTTSLPAIAVPAAARTSKSPVLPSKPLTTTSIPTAPAPVSSRTPLASLNPATNKSSSPTANVAKTKQSPIAPPTTASSVNKENPVAVNTVAPAKKQVDAVAKTTKKAVSTVPSAPITAAPAVLTPLPPVTIAPAVLAPAQLLSSLVSGRDSLLKLLNDGTLKQLMELQTIGKKRAQLILSKREELGGYHTIADLCHIGLSETQVEQFTQRNLMSSVWSATQAVQMEE